MTAAPPGADDLDWPGRRRAKFVLDREVLHRALGLPEDVHVAMVHVTRDPDMVHVTIEGPGVPEREAFGGEVGQLAWRGLTSPQQLPHLAHWATTERRDVR